MTTKTKVRALSLAQARACENAVHPHCDCRCGGAAHGKGRARTDSGEQIPEDQIPRDFFEGLPPDDPHRLPNPAELRARRKRLQERRKLVKQLEQARRAFARWGGQPHTGDGESFGDYWQREVQKAEARLIRFDDSAPIGEGAAAVRTWTQL